MRVVILQPLFIPWIGHFEQIALADVFVHYDDVAMPQGRSFTQRVQIKTPADWMWLSAPYKKAAHQPIMDVVLDESRKWRTKHLAALRHNYARSPHGEAMMDLARGIYEFPTDKLCDFNINAIERVAEWLGLDTPFMRSSSLGIGGRSSRRLFDLVTKLGGSTYLTGHGAANYLDHQLFEDAGIAVEYIDYARKEYPQPFGKFNPHVSILDPIANVGKTTRDLMVSPTVGWREFIEARHRIEIGKP